MLSPIEITLLLLIAFLVFVIIALVVFAAHLVMSARTDAKENLSVVTDLVRSLGEVSSTIERLMDSVNNSASLTVESKREFIEALRISEMRILSSIERVESKRPGLTQSFHHSHDANLGDHATIDSLQTGENSTNEK